MELNSKSFPATVQEKTGKTWEEWFAFLDKGQCAKMNHKQIVAYIASTFPVNPWWGQMVTVGYEKHKGLRQENEKPSGFQISVSKTFNLPVKYLFDAFHKSAKRKKWLSEAVNIVSSREDKKMRMTREADQSTVEIRFTEKGEQKCTVNIDHSKLKNKSTAEKTRKFWKEKLEALAG